MSSPQKDVVGIGVRAGAQNWIQCSERRSTRASLGSWIAQGGDDNAAMAQKSPVPFSDRERERLEALLDALPGAPDISALDGFLVGVLLQPQPVPASRWLPFLHDFDHGRMAPPAATSLAPLHALAQRRHAELAAAIQARRWFDPWVYDLAPAEPGGAVTPSEIVLPWIAGWAAALEHFPALLAQAGPTAHEPLATLYAHFDPEDLEDEDGDLAELIAQAEPPQTPAEAVEDLVRCTLLLADALQPRARR